MDSEREEGEEENGFLNSIQIIERIYQLFPDLPFPPEVVSSKPRSAADAVTGPVKQVARKALPMAELVSGLQEQLDRTFAEHQGLTAVVKPQMWAQNFRVFNLNFSERAPTFDKELSSIAKNITTSSAVLVQDKVLVTWDNTTRQSLAILSCMDFYLAAMINRFSGSTSGEDMETLSFLHAMGNGLSNLTQVNGFLSATILQQRRQACLDRTKLDGSLKSKLMAQPWAAKTLFNGMITDCLKGQQTLDQVSANQTLLKACSAFERMGHTQKRPNPNFQRTQQRKQRGDWKQNKTQPQNQKFTETSDKKGVKKPYFKPQHTGSWRGRKQSR